MVAQFRMGTCWFNEKQFEKAIVEYLWAHLLYPQYKERAIEARFRVGLSYEGLGKPEEAKKEYERILQEKDLKEEDIKRVRERLEGLKGG
ncbi:Cell division coordinator CpoB [subsurface metagenome]